LRDEIMWLLTRTIFPQPLWPKPFPMGRGKGRAPKQRPYVFDQYGARKRAAGAKAFDMLLGIYASCKKLSAKDFCILAHYLNDSGMVGAPWARFSRPPGLQSGKYKRHLDKHIPEGGPFYTARLATTNRKTSHQTSRPIIFRQVFRTIHAEVTGRGDILQKLQDPDFDDVNCVLSVPAYRDHPLVKKNIEETGQYPLPLAVYIDGVRFTPIQAGRYDAPGWRQSEPQKTKRP
jgi:hypothetical protein